MLCISKEELHYWRKKKTTELPVKCNLLLTALGLGAQFKSLVSVVFAAFNASLGKEKECAI